MRAKAVWSDFRKRVGRASHTKAVHHAHNVAYCVYYGIALAEDRGLKLVVVTVIFLATLLATLAASDVEV